MPELPEVETTVRGLTPAVPRRPAHHARRQLRRADLRRAFPADLGQVLTGATVTTLVAPRQIWADDTDRGAR
jgi:formamidopyrimidine-DNA glycosylase